MAAITDKGMQAKTTDTEQWLTQPFMRGAGVFVGRITPGGERLFYFRYTDSKGGRPFLPIGPYHPKGENGLTLAQAYDKASELSALYRSGVKDLRGHFEQVEQEQRRTEHAAHLEAERVERAAADAAVAAARRLTVRMLFNQWQRFELAPQVLADGTRTGRKDGGLWVKESFERRVFGPLGDVPAADVRKADLLAILDECKAGGARRTANVLLADLKQMFRFAADRDIVIRNPLDGIRRGTVGGKDTERDRILTDEELRALWGAVPLAGMSTTNAAATWLLLATGTRVGEAMGARWDDVDMVARTWYLPDTKNQRDHTIHLSDFALRQFDILASTRDIGPDGALVPWVFPATDRERPVCVKSFGKQLADRQRPADRRMSGRTKKTESLALPGGRWTAHDLRRTAATIMARLGISTDVIDECLNHKLQSKVARVYIKDRRMADQARAFDALGSWLDQLLAGRPADNVVPMKAA